MNGNKVHLSLFLTPSKFSMVLWLVKAVTFDAFQTLNSAWKNCVSPFPAVFTLRDPRVHVYSSDSCYVFTDVEASIDEHLGIASALDVPYVDPHDGHVRFGWHLDNSRFGY